VGQFSADVNTLPDSFDLKDPIHRAKLRYALLSEAQCEIWPPENPPALGLDRAQAQKEASESGAGPDGANANQVAS
jgi:hypothetical protein